MTAGALTRPLRRTLIREQALVAGAQVASGVGNLVFSLVAARLLAPGAFADLVAFLALYLVVSVPASSLSAGGALTPALVPAARRRALLGGTVAAAAVAALSAPLGALLGVPTALLLVLAAGVPAAPWLALERGRLYGERRHARAAASLVAEPALRLGLGLPLAAALGPAGGAAGVVAGGWLALIATRPLAGGAAAAARPRRRCAADDEEGAGAARAAARAARRTAWPAAGAFLALALLQNQDVVLANALLDGGQAGRFAVLSTLGGIAAFASTTVPLVLLPRARAGEPGALATAVGAAAALGAAAVAVVAVMPADVVGAAFGERYASAGRLAVPYVAAMALFGVARVLVAHRCATAPGLRAIAAPAAIAAAHATAIVVLGRSAGTVAAITLAAMAALVLASAGGVVVALPRRGGGRTAPPAPAPALPRPRVSRAAAVVGVLTLAGLALRVAATRGIWLDEATSITQAQMSLPGLLHNLRTTDVHPPLHHLTLWVLAHTLGISEPVMRAPSLAAGAALIPVLYLTGRELWDERAGMAAAALGAVAPFLVWYSEEARMYAYFMLFATVAVLGQLRALRRGRPADWALYVLASAALVWSQYFGALMVVVQQAAFACFAWRDRRHLRGWLLAAAALALLLAPLLPFAADQFHANEAAGRGFDQPSQAGAGVGSQGHGPGVYAALTNVVWAIWGYHSNGTMAALTALWPVGLLLALLMLGRGRSPRTLLVVACAVVPAIALYLIGEKKPFLFEIRYFAALAPLAVLLLARAATAWTRGAAGAAVAVGLLLASFGVAAADQQLNRANPRVYDFEGAITRLDREARPGDVVLYEPQFLADVIRYYGPHLAARPLQDGLPKQGPVRRVFLLGSFLDHPGARAGVRDAVRRLERRRTLVERFQRPQVKVWVFR